MLTPALARTLFAGRLVMTGSTVDGSVMLEVLALSVFLDLPRLGFLAANVRLGIPCAWWMLLLLLRQLRW